MLVEDERIAAVGPDLPAEGATVVDASGALVIPGGIDVHTHFDLPVGAVRSADDFESGTIAAACGGTTCVIDFAGAGREPPDEALAVWHERAARAAVDYGFHLTVTSVPEDEEAAARLFAGFVDAGVTSVKLYMAYPERLMVDDATLGRAFAAGVRAGVLVCVHAEDGLEVERLVRERLEAGDTGPDAIPRARPPVVEADAIRRAATLAAAAGSPVYVVHLSSAAGLEAVRSANEGGARVLAETCPQYLFLTDEALRQEPADVAANFVCQPPVRTDADREALWGGLAAGPVGVISTDHCPFTVADRRRGVTGEGWTSFAEIPGGQPGVETRVGLAYQGRPGRSVLR